MILQNPNGTNNVLWIRNARLSFPNVLVPKSVEKGPPKYSCNFLLTPDAPEWSEIGQILQELATERWKEHAPAAINMINQDKWMRCYGIGSEKTSRQTGEVYEGYTGNVVWIGGSNNAKPTLYGTDGKELPPTANANTMFVGGNYCDGVISLWLQDNEYGRGVRSNLVAVQYLREGEHFGSEEVDAAGIFQPVAGAPAATASAPGMPSMGQGNHLATGGMPVAPAPAPASKNIDFL